MVTFTLRKESARKCVYTNGYTIASTLFGGKKKKKKVLSLGQDQKGIIGDVVGGSCRPPDQEDKASKLKRSLPMAGIDPHGGFQTPATNLLGS